MPLIVIIVVVIIMSVMVFMSRSFLRCAFIRSRLWRQVGRCWRLKRRGTLKFSAFGDTTITIIRWRFFISCTSVYRPLNRCIRCQTGHYTLLPLTMAMGINDVFIVSSSLSFFLCSM
ncbi:hypothetical protein GGI35DRAFT_465372 [Trichoderma velutinum]